MSHKTQYERLRGFFAEEPSAILSFARQIHVYCSTCAFEPPCAGTLGKRKRAAVSFIRLTVISLRLFGQFCLVHKVLSLCHGTRVLGLLVASRWKQKIVVCDSWRWCTTALSVRWTKPHRADSIFFRGCWSHDPPIPTSHWLPLEFKLSSLVFDDDRLASVTLGILGLTNQNRSRAGSGFPILGYKKRIPEVLA